MIVRAADRSTPLAIFGFAEALAARCFTVPLLGVVVRWGIARKFRRLITQDVAEAKAAESTAVCGDRARIGGRRKESEEQRRSLAAEGARHCRLTGVIRCEYVL